jgi:hypothetical protein
MSGLVSYNVILPGFQGYFVHSVIKITFEFQMFLECDISNFRNVNASIFCLFLSYISARM